MKLWLLDADVIIDLLGFGIFDLLVENHELHVAEGVADEVRFFKQKGVKISVNFREEYIESGRVRLLSASTDEVKAIISKLPQLFKDSIHDGELESLAILVSEESLTFCSCDAAAIRALPFLDCSERGISVEKLLRKSGITLKGLKENHQQSYFDSNLRIGKEQKIQYF